MDNDFIKKIGFRRLNEKDKELFIKLRMLFLSELFDNTNESDMIQIEKSIRTYFDDHINKNDFIGMIGECEGNIVSVACIVMSDFPAYPDLINGKAGTLINVYTFPEYRKKGISKKIITEIINEAKTMGVNSITLKSTEEGYSLYKKLGFEDDNNYKGMILKLWNMGCTSPNRIVNASLADARSGYEKHQPGVR